jgi:hypothetical protein
MWTVWDGVVDTTVRRVRIMCVRGRVLAQIGEVIMAVNVVCSDPLDGRAWTIVDPIMEGMGWHVVRVEEDYYTLTTIAVADSEGDAVDFVRAALLGGAE